MQCSQTNVQGSRWHTPGRCTRPTGDDPRSWWASGQDTWGTAGTSLATIHPGVEPLLGSFLLFTLRSCLLLSQKKKVRLCSPVHDFSDQLQNLASVETPPAFHDPTLPKRCHHLKNWRVVSALPLRQVEGDLWHRWACVISALRGNRTKR